MYNKQKHFSALFVWNTVDNYRQELNQYPICISYHTGTREVVNLRISTRPEGRVAYTCTSILSVCVITSNCLFPMHGVHDITLQLVDI